MITPPFLNIGDSVCIVSPSGFIDVSFIDNAIAVFHAWGLKVILGKNVLKNHGIFAGTDQERIADFQWALDNPDVKAIICSRGGYGAIRICDKLDYSNFIENPKWIVGFSDITIFHEKLQSLNISSIHASMPKNFPSASEEALNSLKNCLFGFENEHKYSYDGILKDLSFSAPLIGGNLSIIYSLLGSDISYDFEGKILFIEDLNERFYHLDRMMHSLKYAGVFDKISVLLVGAMTDMTDGATPYGMDAYQIIKSCVEPYKIPCIFNFPVGHVSDNQAVQIGADYTISVKGKKISVKKLLHKLS
ncbi:MAG: LD-carboxypeptidase [Bacteroidales bacterium]|nr:LD-carboxypeptidase [Bacteroidales bacterium]